MITLGGSEGNDETASRSGHSQEIGADRPPKGEYYVGFINNCLTYSFNSFVPPARRATKRFARVRSDTHAMSAGR